MSTLQDPATTPGVWEKRWHDGNSGNLICVLWMDEHNRWPMPEEAVDRILRAQQVAEAARKLRGSIGHAYISEQAVFRFISEYDATASNPVVQS